MKHINTPTFDFPTLIQEGFAYVDKTRQIYELAQPGTDGTYVFEFKFRKNAEAALAQCRERNYAAAFAAGPRPVYYVGVNYSPRKNVRTINDVRCEKA